MREDEPAVAVRGRHEGFPVPDLPGSGFAKLQGALEHIPLHGLKQVPDPLAQGLEGNEFLLPRISAHDHRLAGRDIPRTELHAQRHALRFPFGELPAQAELLAVVHLHPHAFQRRNQLVDGFLYDGLFLVGLRDGNDDDLVRRQAGRQYQPPVVAMGHDDGADGTGAHAPTRLVDMFARPVPRLKIDVEGPGEVLPQVVRSAHLQGLAVLHHAFDGVGLQRAGELFGVGFRTVQHRNRHVVFREGSVDVQDAQGLLLGLRRRGVGRVAFLPEKFSRPQEGSRPQFPPEDIGPLVDQQRQVAIGLDPPGVHVRNDGLGGRADHEAFFELLAPARA